MKYQFRASRSFWRSFSKLSIQEQKSAKGGVSNLQGRSF